MEFIEINNNQSIPFSSIPVLEYENFLNVNVSLLGKPENHCVNFYGLPQMDYILLICCVANDTKGTIAISASLVSKKKSLPSFTHFNLAFQSFEREIHENFGIEYIDHPWIKPLRYPYYRANENNTIQNYPFFKIHSEELHEIGVGPIHAGVIEPGHFRFICNGEQILHLEIQLGYQHRGIEKLFVEKHKLLQRHILAESIAGDTVAGHTTAFANLYESLCAFQSTEEIRHQRTLALELERMAVHTGDLGAMCTDVGYQLGSAVFGRLRTPLINFFQKWCGNRLAKGLIRVGKTNYSMTDALVSDLHKLLSDYQPDFDEMCMETFALPSVSARFERTGVVTYEQAKEIGTVGMAARTSGINRDIRASHPHDLYEMLEHMPLIKHHGDVYSRAQIRKAEIRQSMEYIRKLLNNVPEAGNVRENLKNPGNDMFCLSLVEGWRGEICHSAITNENGEIVHYKIKDPSLHNWLALALSVRNNEISDFPICNKSFDLSYCGHDL